MKRFPVTAALLSTAVILAGPAIASDVAVSLSVGQPGFYGQLDIGDYPQPRTIYRNPVMIQRVAYDRQPIYLNVPPGHSKNWRKHCGRYNACGERVYFVSNSWYEHEYAPRYQARHDWHNDHDGRDNYRDNRDNNHDGRDNDRKNHNNGKDNNGNNGRSH